MACTREQLNEAIQAKNNHPAKHSRMAITVSAVLLLLKTGVSSGIGALVGWGLSYVSLSPLVAGGIIGSAISLICFVSGVCCGFYGFSPDEEDISEEHKRILKEYKNSLERRTKIFIQCIVEIIVSFGIGVVSWTQIICSYRCYSYNTNFSY
ncbi:MAG: hypothetical protein LKM43_03585 [Wolbachia endosymbiont of Penenirmus auritus]|nr:hypothetical protein [Wolbachia endosymbiont of Penenirmus auritus]